MWWIYVILVSSSIAVRCMTVYLRGVETAPSYERIECSYQRRFIIPLLSNVMTGKEAI
jgi:hypothetical protein